MSALLLVRHGQASWGAADYDVLSALGHEQAAALGRSWRDRVVGVDAVVRGAMRRHDETAATVLAALGSPPSVEVDAGWDEFDHVAILTAHAAAGSVQGTDADAVFEAAIEGWRGGSYDAAVEPWGTSARGCLLPPTGRSPGTASPQS